MSRTTAVKARDHVVVCGLERLGLRIVEELRGLGQEVVVLAKSPAVTFADRARAAGATVMEGTSQEEDHLLLAGIANARALVLSEDSDLGNLHAGIVAQELNPGLQVVLRIFNSELARRASALLSDSQVLALSALSAPTLAHEALDTGTANAVQAWGRLVVLRDTGEEEVVLAQLGDGAVLADGGEAPPALTAVQLQRHRRRVTMRALRAFFDRRLALVLGLVFVLSWLSVSIFAVFDHLSLADAIYFTFTTITTVGYGDINLATSANWLKLYDVGFMLFGATALAGFYALVTDAIVGARLSAALGVPHGKIKNHVVVCGLGNVGFRVVEHLVQRGIQVTACDLNPDGRFVQAVRQLDVPVQVGDALLPSTLHRLGVDHARAVIATTEDDVANVEVMMSAREINPKARLVARVFDQKLAERAAGRFGIDAAHSVSAIAAPYFAAAAMGNDVNTLVHVGDRTWLVVERMIAPGAPAADMKVTEFEASGEVAILAVRDNAGDRWGPERGDTIKAGQQLLLATTVEHLPRVRSLSSPGGGPPPRTPGD
ncbi:MAG: NAD-binding protein [Candidatus Dormibacteria bacterium]